MVEFVIESGPDNGKVLTCPRLPCAVGRSRTVDVRLEGPGIWERHAEVTTEDGRCFLRVVGHATACRDGVACHGWSLRNGESFMLGGVRLRFAISAAPHGSLRPLEWAAWTAVGWVVVVEAWLALG